MTWQIAFVLLLLLATFAAMVWEKVSLDIVAMVALCALLATGILTPDEAFRVFSNDAAITVACMFILSAALERTGAIELIGRRLNRAGGQSDLHLLLVMLPIVSLISAFVNNTPVVVVFMPLMISLATQRGIVPSKLLMPLSFASIFGGCCTLIGTSTNILVSAVAEELGQKPLGMFELSKIGVIMAAVGMAYLLAVGRRFLPRRETLASLLQSTTAKEYLTEAVIVAGSPLIGKRLAETPLKSLPNSRILDITRGGEPLTTSLDEIVLRSGDRLRLTTVMSSVMEIKDLKGVEILPHANLGLEPVGMQKAVVLESVVGPDSELIGKTIRKINFRQRYGVLILAVHREGKNLSQNFENVRLRFGDTLLMEGSESAINHLRENRNFLLLTDVQPHLPRWSKMWIAIATLTLVVALATVTKIPISAWALMGVVVVVLTGCLETEEAYRAIEWRIIFMLFGLLSLGAALAKTKGAELIATSFIHACGWMGPRVILSAVYFVTTVLTEFLSNNAVAVLLTPIAINAAAALGVDARPFVIAVALGASASFATPIGYQTNTLVYGAGGYQFRDFVKVGGPLNLLFWILATVLIPLFFPFQPSP